MIRLGVLGSTNGTDLQAILDAIESRRLISEVSVVISNKKNAFILERAKKYKVPYHYISHKHIDRETFDGRITSILNRYNVDLVLLIGFMRILSGSFCRAWKGKILNVQKARISRNPRTGEKVNTPQKKTIHFKMSKDLFKKLNND